MPMVEVDGGNGGGLGGERKCLFVCYFFLGKKNQKHKFRD